MERTTKRLAVGWVAARKLLITWEQTPELSGDTIDFCSGFGAEFARQSAGFSEIDGTPKKNRRQYQLNSDKVFGETSQKGDQMGATQKVVMS